jgi:hypothetical protein
LIALRLPLRRKRSVSPSWNNWGSHLFVLGRRQLGVAKANLPAAIIGVDPIFF